MTSTLVAAKNCTSNNFIVVSILSLGNPDLVSSDDDDNDDQKIRPDTSINVEAGGSGNSVDPSQN